MATAEKVEKELEKAKNEFDKCVMRLERLEKLKREANEDYSNERK